MRFMNDFQALFLLLSGELRVGDDPNYGEPVITPMDYLGDMVEGPDSLFSLVNVGNLCSDI